MSRWKASSTRQRSQGGLTLFELMTVVAMVGILSTLAVVTLRRERDAPQVADALGVRIGECVRLASMGGPVRADVAATGITARARIVIAAVDDQQTFTLDRLVEDELPADTAMWQVVSTLASGVGIRVAGYRDSAVLTAGLGPSTMLADDTLEIECFPDGTTSARTLYLQDSHGHERTRITVLPLSGQAITNRGW